MSTVQLPGVDKPTQTVILVDSAGNPASIGGSGTAAGEVQGNVASATGDSGKPVKVAGVYNSTPATASTGQRIDAQATANGSLRTLITGVTSSGANGLTNTVVQVVSDSSHTTRNNMAVSPWIFNGSTQDQMPGNTTGVFTVNKGTATLATGQVPVGTGSTQIVPARTGRSSVKITNLGVVDIFIGATGVAAGTGDLLLGVKGSSITLRTSAAVFGIAASTQSVSFIEEY